MRLERLVLENVCQHQHLEHVWEPGLNGIVGPNGSGKSNLLKAIQFAINGGFDNAGTKAENICQLAGDKARSRVILIFEHNGIKVEIVRVLRRGTSYCLINSTERVDGDTAVTTAVMDVLGVDQRILSEYIFVPQRHMTGFVDETPGERSKTFGQLFDLARAEAIYKMLDAEAKRVNPAPPNPEIDTWRARVARKHARYTELNMMIDASHSRWLYDESGELFSEQAAKELIKRADEWERRRQIISVNEVQVDELTVDLEARQKELADALEEQAELREAKDGIAEDIDAAQAALTRWEAVQRRREQQAVLQARQDALDAEPEENLEPQLPNDYPGEEALQSRTYDLTHDIRIRNELLEKFKGEPRVCPTCGAETDAILEKAAIYKEELPELKRLLAAANKLSKAYTLYKMDHAKWQYWSQDHAKRRVVLACDWASLQTGEEEEDPVTDPETCRTAVAAGAGLDRAIADMEIRIDQLRQEVRRWSSRLDEVMLKVARLWRVQGYQPEPEDVEKAKAGLVRSEQGRRDTMRYQGEQEALVPDLLGEQDLLKRMEDAEAKAELDRLWVYHLGEVRKVMHHDRLPKVVAHNYLEVLSDDTNELLESFDADFRVGLGEGLNFTATFLRGLYAGAVSPAQRLSEGQKVLLALAFRVAVNSLFAGTAGLLCLDEPTESLDERNLACLEVAIGKMRDLSESRGLQCLLVTHEPSFEVLFDGVLRLVA